MTNGDRTFRIALDEMRQQSLLCDVTLIVDEHTKTSAHRAVLAAASPFFRAMFDPTMKPSAGDRVPLPGIAADILADIVGYLYTGDIKIGGANVHGLLEAATLLQLPALRTACADTLSAHLTTDTCLRIRRLAKQHDSVTLLRQADDFIKEHWTEMDGSADFVRLMQGEPVIEPLTTMSFEASLSSSPACACGGVNNEAPNDELKTISKSLTLAETNKPQIMTIISTTSTLSYDFEKNRWTKTKEKPTDSDGYVLFQCGYKFCIINHNDSMTADVYETHTGMWNVMHLNIESSGRVSATYALLNGTIYALGGQYPANEVDWFDTRTRCWQPAAPLNHPRCCMGVIEMDGFLYAVGGINNYHRKGLDIAERYDPSTNTWETIASMSVSRKQPTLCVLDGKLYAVGSSSIVEAYDPQSNTWQKVAEMSIERICPGVVAHAGELYVMGGVRYSSIEIYCPKSNTWRRLNTRLPVLLHSFNVCIHDKQERDKNRWIDSLLY